LGFVIWSLGFFSFGGLFFQDQNKKNKNENGHWSLVIGHWSLVIGHWSLVIGHWSLVIGH
jgi:hypothetical protein